MIHATDPGALARTGRLARIGAACALAAVVSTGFAPSPDTVGSGPDADSTQSTLTLTIRSAQTDDVQGSDDVAGDPSARESHSGALSNEDDPSAGSQSSFDVDPVPAVRLEPSAGGVPHASTEPTSPQRPEAAGAGDLQDAYPLPSTAPKSAANASPGQPAAGRSTDVPAEADDPRGTESDAAAPAAPWVPESPSLALEPEGDASGAESGEDLVALGAPSEKAMAGVTTTGQMPWQALLTGTLAAAAVTVGLRARRLQRSR